MINYEGQLAQARPFESSVQQLYSANWSDSPVGYLRPLFRPVEAYADALSTRTHGITTMLSFAVFVGVIVFRSVSLHSIAMTELSIDDRLVLVPKIGMILTIVSRLLDSLENLWVILIYANPDSYPTALITLMNTTESLKWAAVTIEYPTFGLAIVLALVVRFTGLFESPGSQQ